MKRSRVKRKTGLRKRSQRGKLLTVCDRLFRLFILSRRPHKCEWCGKPMEKGLQISHILPKGRYPRLRYCPANVLLLCNGCHIFKWHKHPLKAQEFIERYKGEGYYQKLLVLDKIYPKLTMFHLNNLIEVYKKYEKQRRLGDNYTKENYYQAKDLIAS